MARPCRWCRWSPCASRLSDGGPDWPIYGTQLPAKHRSASCTVHGKGRPVFPERPSLVAGAGFEPATFGL